MSPRPGRLSKPNRNRAKPCGISVPSPNFFRSITSSASAGSRFWEADRLLPGRRKDGGVMVGDEPISSALNHDEREACGPRRTFGCLDLVEPDAHRRGVAECDHVSVTNCDLGAASWERLEIFADRRGTDIERRAGRAVQKAVGGVKLYDCIGLIGVHRCCPTVDDGPRLLGWTSKRLRRQEYQKPDGQVLNNAQHFPLLL